nr:hypothetical protein [Tanacetum cinerariifolium]
MILIFCYNSNSFGFDQYQPLQYSVTHQPPQEKSLVELLLEAKFPQALQTLCEKINKYVQEKQEENNIAEEQAAKVSSQYWKPPILFDENDDDDEKSSIPLRDIIFELSLSVAIIPDFLITNSLSIRDEHLSTIPEKESDKVIKSSVEDLVPIPSESKDLFDIEKSDLIEALLNRDTLLVSSPKFYSLLKEFSIELSHIDLISPKIDEADLDPEEEIRLVEKLFDSLMEEIDIFLAPDDSITPGIENDDYDSEGGVLFLEELLNDDSISLPKNESFHFDHYYDPSSPRPPMKPPDDDGIYFDANPDTGIWTIKVADDISECYVLKPRILSTQPTLSLCPVNDTLLPFLFENENKVFNPGIPASKEEKSPHLLSHRGFKASQLISDFSESPVMIYGGNIPILKVLFLHFYPP